MSVTMDVRERGPDEAAFRHEALLYDGQDEFVASTTSFIQDAVAADEPILVMVEAAKIALLRSALAGAGAGTLEFADMAQVGRNPARIIPAWQQFASAHAGGGRRLRGIGEPVWPGRRPEEITECQQHEALLNLAFADSPAFWLLCPYDAGGLDHECIEEARRSHPFMARASGDAEHAAYHGDGLAALDGPLPPPPYPVQEVAFGGAELGELRRWVTREARAAGFGAAQTDDFVLAVDETATNSLRHGGGRGVARLWHDDDALVCDIRDQGRITEPLVGRKSPNTHQERGRGLWIVNQLCDLVQLRSSSGGTTVRLHMRHTSGFAPSRGRAGGGA